MSIKIKYYHHYYYRLIRRINPKIIFFDNGYYGGIRVCAINIANSLGIITGEYQHGYVDCEHFAYNYPKSFNKKGIKNYYPNYFFTMGKYWSDNIRIPGNTHIMGNPHLYYKLNEINLNNYKEDNILFIAGYLTRNENIKLVKEFYKQNGSEKYNIIFRLHPRDEKNLELYKELNEYSNLQISISDDVYNDISRCQYIVGDFSTVLYEAIPFKKPIFIIKNEMSSMRTNEKFGIWFKDSKELLQLLNNKNSKNIDYDSEYYWNSNWKENYINFIQNKVYK